jgi:hypothetical protein
MNRAFALLGLVAALGGSACTPSIGSPCTESSDCASQGNRFCDTSQPEGYCTVYGCADNSCPDHAVCVTFHAALPSCDYNDYLAPARTSRTLCLQHCATDADCRTSEGYLCLNPRVAPVNGEILDDNQDQMVCTVAATPATAEPGDGGPSPICNAGRLLPEAGAGDAAGDDAADAP